MLHSERRQKKLKKLQEMRRANMEHLAFIRQFRKDEDGGLIVLTILLLITMLVMGGMAVDFMRFESERAKLQSVADRAVLSAAELSLDSSLDEVAVVRDFYKSAGLESTIVGTPVVIDTGNSKTVSVQSRVNVDTFFLRLVGIDNLTAPANSAAIEGIGKVEISLVLDISGSMRFGGSGDDGRFGDMQDAAIAFANKVLDPANGGQVSLNIIPYAGSTNPGPQMFDYLNAVRIESSLSEEEIAEGQSDPFQVSSCVEMEPSDWTSSGMPGSGRDQVPHFMNWAIAADVMDWGWCPQDRSAIRYALSSASEAADFINGIRMHDGTGTHYGMKYGLAALDPATQPAFEHLNSLDIDDDGVTGDLLPDEFVNRPAAWDDPETRKIIILMTDGQITDQYRPKDYLDERNLESHLSSGRRNTLTNRSSNLTSFYAACDMAKASTRDIEVYTVAFETYGSGKTEMETCASDISMFFPASGAGLTQVFEDIADQITELRLSL